MKICKPHPILLGLIAICVISPIAKALTQPAPDSRQEILHQLGRRNVRVHDPSAIVKCKNDYWIFFTGVNTPSTHSTDLINWTPGPRTFAAPARLGKTSRPRQSRRSLGTRCHQDRRPLPPLRLRLQLRQKHLRHRRRHQRNTRSQRPGLSLDRRRRRRPIPRRR